MSECSEEPKNAWRVKWARKQRMALEGNGSGGTDGQTVTTNLAVESASG